MRRFLASGQAWLESIDGNFRDQDGDTLKTLRSGCLLKDNSVFLLKKSSLFVFFVDFQ